MAPRMIVPGILPTRGSERTPRRPSHGKDEPAARRSEVHVPTLKWKVENLCVSVFFRARSRYIQEFIHSLASQLLVHPTYVRDGGSHSKGDKVGPSPVPGRRLDGAHLPASHHTYLVSTIPSPSSSRRRASPTVLSLSLSYSLGRRLTSSPGRSSSQRLYSPPARP